MSQGIPLDIKLLNLLAAIRDMPPFDAMSADEECMLHNLLIRWHEQEELFVSTVMNGMAGASGTTAYRRLLSLRDKGLVQLRIDSADRRVKHVEPTALAETYRQQIRQAVAVVAVVPNS